jgi:hypothetical protein
VAIAYDVKLLDLLHRITADPASVNLQSAEGTAEGAVDANYALLACLLFTGVMFMCWMFTAMRAGHRLNSRLMRRRPRWAIWSWLIPVLNLFEPKAIVNDLWDVSASGAAKRPILLNAWWTLWLVGLLLDRLVASVAGTGLSASKSTLTFAVAGVAVQMCGAVLAIAVVVLLTHQLVQAQPATDVGPVLAGPRHAQPRSPSSDVTAVSTADDPADAELDAKWARFVQQADG